MFNVRVAIVSAVLVAASLSAVSSPAQADSRCTAGITGLRTWIWLDEMSLVWNSPCPGVSPETEYWENPVRELPGDVAPTSTSEGNGVVTNGPFYEADISSVADGRDHTFSVFNPDFGDGPSGPASITLTGTTMTQDVSPARAVAGEPVTISGRLIDSTGAPVAGQTILIFNRFFYDDDGRTVLGSTTTAEDGTYTFVDHPTHNMLYMAVFAGSDTLMNVPLEREADVSVSVAPSTRLVAHRHSGARRTTFSLQASVTPLRGASKTRTVTLQTLRHGKWHNVTGHHLSRTGRASFKIRPGSHGRHHYRVYKKHTSSQGTGVSRTVTLTVG